MIYIYIAFLMDIILGDPYWYPHPVIYMGKYIKFYENKIRKGINSEKGLKIAGIFLVITITFITYISSYLLLKIVFKIHPLLFGIINILLLWNCLALKCLNIETTKVYKALKKDDISLSRKMISYLVGRDTSELDEVAITKASVETIAENTSDGVIAPLFYMFIGGAPLALVYKAINTMDSMVGYKNDKYMDFGWAAAKIDDVANYIPARITGLLISVASVIMNLDWKSSFIILSRDSRNHSSPNSGFPEASVAGALGIQLGGSNKYFGKLVHKPTIGDNIRNIEKEDIILTIRLMYIASIISLIIFSVLRYIIK